MRKTILIIGGGPAGVEAALAAAPYAEVTLISDRPFGSWHKLMPSRVWMTAVDRLYEASRWPIGEAQQESVRDRFALVEVLRYVEETARAWNTQQRRLLEDAGVRLLSGWGQLLSPTRARISRDGQHQDLDTDAIIIATGARQVAPPNLAPDGKRVFSPATADAIPAVPASLIWIGDGNASFEFVHIFVRLGVAVTWCVLEPEPRSTFNSKADRFLVAALRKRGVTIAGGQAIVDLERYADKVVAVQADGTRLQADMAFVNVGQRPDVDSLNLQAMGVETDDRGVVATDAFGRTSLLSIYLVGDAGAPTAAGIAMAQGRIAAHHAAGLATDPFDWRHIVRTFNSAPAVAQVGLLEGNGTRLETVTVSFDETIKTHITGHTEGFFTLAWVEDGHIAGGLAVGAQAAEALAPVGLAIRMQATLHELASMYGPHPSVCELPYIAARRRLDNANG